MAEVIKMGDLPPVEEIEINEDDSFPVTKVDQDDSKRMTFGELDKRYFKSSATTDLAQEQTLQEVFQVLNFINVKDFATSAKQLDIITAINAIKTGLATSAKQDQMITAINNISFNKTGLATDVNQATIIARIESIITSLGGKATESTLSSVNSSVQAITTALADKATSAKQDESKSVLDQMNTKLGIISVPSFTPRNYDEVALTYNSAGDIETVIYKLASATVATLTLSYTGGNLTGVVKS